MPMKGIQAYTDYRQFLRDYVAQRRKASARWSLGTWARQLGLSQTGAISMILGGRRHPGPELMVRLVHHFNFNVDEARHFNLLVCSQKTTDPVIRELLSHVTDAGFKQTRPRRLSANEFAPISRWYFYLIRELTRLSDFQPKAAWVRQRIRPKLASTKINQALHTLIASGLLSLDKKGRLKPDPEPLVTTTDVPSVDIRRGHRDFIGLALDALENVDVAKREFVTSTISIRRADLPRIKALIRQFQDELAGKFEIQDNGDSIYQLNIQFFPLTKEVG